MKFAKLGLLGLVLLAGAGVFHRSRRIEITPKIAPSGATTMARPNDVAAAADDLRLGGLRQEIFHAHARLDEVETKANEVSTLLTAINELQTEWENGRIDAASYLAKRKEITSRYLED